MDGPGTWSRIQRRGSQRPLWIGKTVFFGVPSMAINRSEGIATAAQSGSSADEVERLLGEMSVLPYVGPYLTMVSPTVWELHFTRPMLRLLELGPAVQSHLLPSRLLKKSEFVRFLGPAGPQPHCLQHRISRMRFGKPFFSNLLGCQIRESRTK
jgi:hypothetical protein